MLSSRSLKAGRLALQRLRPPYSLASAVWKTQHRSLTNEASEGEAEANEGEAEEPKVQLYGVGGRYAHGLFGAATSCNALQRVHEELQTIISVAESNEEFADFLQDPTMSREEKRETIVSFLGTQVHEITSRFFEVLAENGRLGDVSVIAESFGTLVDAHSGKVNALVTTAQELSSSEYKNLVSSLEKLLDEGQTLSVEVVVDPSILGGIKVDMGDRSLDLSVSSKIDRFRKVIQDWTG